MPADPEGDVLLVSPVVPDAAGDGRERRAYAWVAALAVRHRVHLLVVAGPGYRARDRSGAAALPLATEHRIDIAPRRLHELRVIASSLAARGSTARLFWSPLGGDHANVIERWYTGLPVGRVLCFRLYVAEHAARAAAVTGATSVELDLDDVESATWASIASRMRANGDRLPAFRAGIAARQFRDAEDEWLPRFSCVYVCSKDDRQRLLQRFPALRVDVRPNVLHDPGALPATPAGASPRALFVGSLDYYPNADAVRFFAAEVLPALQRDGWSFDVAGFGAAAKLRRDVAALPGVRWLGAVAEVGPCYAGASVVVAPLRAGGGTKVKVIEALLRGRPVVATAEAVRGLGLDDGVHFLGAETAAGFAAQCRRLASEGGLAERLAVAGRAVALERFVVAGAA